MVEHFIAIEGYVLLSILELWQRDMDLLDLDANERSITHKLAEYIQKHFPDWNVDCEYNRCKNMSKMLPQTVKPDSDDLTVRFVYPDIIIHKRNAKENLLVIEVKKSGDNCSERDKKKLKAFAHNEYEYPYGLFIKINHKNREFILTWYINGEPREDVSYTY